MRPEFVLSDDEGTTRIRVLEDVVDDLKLELAGYRSAARELAIEIERKDRALEAAARECASERGEGRARAIEEATSRLSDRLEKAERAVERERGDGERGRRASERLKAVELELERRMLQQDEVFERKWATRVEEANANAEAFRCKLAKLERETHAAKMSEEETKSELARAMKRIEELSLELTNAPRATEPSDGADVKPRRGLFSFITGVPSEVYAGPKKIVE